MGSLNSVRRAANSLTTPIARLRLQRWRRRRQGMSLMELLIVMGVLSTVVALSWPALRRPLNRSHAQSAAQQLQRDLLSTRRAAMESGQVHWFQYQSTTGTYYCGIHRQFDLAGPAETEMAETTRELAEDEDSNNAMDQRFGLPEGTTFVSPATDSSREGTDRVVESATVSWSRPLRFYPGGRMESGQISLASQDGYQILVEIQGLAGRVRIHSLLRSDAGVGESEEEARNPELNTERESQNLDLPKSSRSSGQSRSD